MEDTRPSSHIAPHIKSEHGPFRPHEIADRAGQSGHILRIRSVPHFALLL